MMIMNEVHTTPYVLRSSSTPIPGSLRHPDLIFPGFKSPPFFCRAVKPFSHTAEYSVLPTFVLLLPAFGENVLRMPD